ILAALTGIVTSRESGRPLGAGEIAAIGGKAVGFLVIAIGVGRLVPSRLFARASRLRARGVLLAMSLAFCFFVAWAAAEIGLAPIVGAFAAGLVLEEAHFRAFLDRGERRLEDLLQPLSSFLVPIFFVVMGLRTELRSFGDAGVLFLALLLSAAAI